MYEVSFFLFVLSVKERLFLAEAVVKEFKLIIEKFSKKKNEKLGNGMKPYDIIEGQKK